jgi:hypothetical protein
LILIINIFFITFSFLPFLFYFFWYALFTNLLGSSGLMNDPRGITSDSVSNPTSVYFVDFNNNRIRALNLVTLLVTSIAGSSSCAWSDGTGSSAQFCNLYQVAFANGNLYLTEYNSRRIRKCIIASRVVTTIAGNTGKIKNLNFIFFDSC